MVLLVFQEVLHLYCSQELYIPYSRPGVSGSRSSLVPPNNELKLVLRELREMKKGQQEINAGIKKLQDAIKTISDELKKNAGEKFQHTWESGHSSGYI